MRQTLLRFRLDDWFSLAPIDGITAIGIGYVALVAIPAFAWWFARNREAILDGSDTEARWLAKIGGLLCVAMLLTPLFAAADAFVPVYGYGFMLFLGFITAAWWAGTRSRAVGLSNDVVWDSCMWLFFGGILGARLFYLVQKHETVFKGATGVRDVIFRIVNLPDGGLVLFGGILLGSIFYTIYCRRNQLDGLLVGDVLIPSFFVGLGFGRLGCFMNGCCFGDACHLPWAVTFPADSVPFDTLVKRGIIPPDATASLALHPTQLYSALNAFLLAGLYHAFFRYRPWNGAVIALALVTYPVTRFLIEYLRADELGQLNTSFTISQIGSFVGWAAGWVLLAWLAWRNQPRSAEPTAT